jgi:hypothetical protein
VCHRENAADQGVLQCASAGSIGQYSNCGPCNENDFNAAACDASYDCTPGKSPKRIYACNRETPYSQGTYQCLKVEKFGTASNCGPCSRRELQVSEGDSVFSDSIPTKKSTTKQDIKRGDSDSDQKVTAEFTVSSSQEDYWMAPKPVGRRLEWEQETKIDDDEIGPYCSAKDFPCGKGNEVQEGMVFVCHYTFLRGHHTLCIAEKNSDMLAYYPHDYCGPCLGVLELLVQRWRN